jgi:hypothetical protein
LTDLTIVQERKVQSLAGFLGDFGGLLDVLLLILMLLQAGLLSSYFKIDMSRNLFLCSTVPGQPQEFKFRCLDYFSHLCCIKRCKSKQMLLAE